MKNIYSQRYLMAALSFFYCFSFSLFAQVTQPVAQSLPYFQNFDGLSTTYPVGIQGGVIGTSASTSYPTTDSTADKAFVNGTSNSGTGALYNYSDNDRGKIGFLNSGSLNLTICLAINTKDKYGIIVQYNAMTIRNPGVRSNEMILQYRVGTLAAFKPLPETAYYNTLVVQTTPAVTTPQNEKTIKFVLPAECDNQEVVQIRWVSKDMLGNGARPSFAITDIDIREDKTAPVSETDFPKAENIFSESFDFSNKLDEKGKNLLCIAAFRKSGSNCSSDKSRP